MSNPTFDARDATILAKRITETLTKELQVGDIVELQDGSTKRVAHDWGDSVQLTMAHSGQSFYLGEGYVSYSGGLERGIERKFFRKMSEPKMASFWFFHHDYAQAHNGVECQAPVNVFKLDQPTEQAIDNQYEREHLPFGLTLSHPE